MERSEFLSKLGLGLAVACTGCGLASCGSKKDNPAPVKNTELFNVDLNSSLVNIGDAVTMDQVILVRLVAENAAASFTALAVVCTHRGGTIAYHADQGIFICPLHGSEFSTTGAVLKGPASTPLKQYKIAINESTLIISG